jgi:DNA-binding transcriptional ArsR family regulator
MRNILDIAKALSDENRVRALMMLTSGEACVCQIVALLNLAPSTVSKHMSILKQAGLVESRKCGRWIYYKIPEQNERISKDIINWLTNNLSEDKLIKEDTERVMKILQADKENLCRKYYHIEKEQEV